MLGARETKGQAAVQRDTQMHWQGRAERRRDRRKQAKMGRWRESGRHPERQKADTQVHTHKSLLLGYPQMSPSTLKGSCAVHLCLGLRCPGGAGSSPSSLIRTRVSISVWDLCEIGMGAVGV